MLGLTAALMIAWVTAMPGEAHAEPAAPALLPRAGPPWPAKTEGFKRHMGAEALIPTEGSPVRADGPLVAITPDAARGRALVADRLKGNCLACHAISELSAEPFHGDFGPSLDGAGGRLTVSQLRQWLVDPSVLKPDAAMPPYHRSSGIIRPYREPEGIDLAGQTLLSAEEIEHVVAYLAGLK